MVRRLKSLRQSTLSLQFSLPFSNYLLWHIKCSQWKNPRCFDEYFFSKNALNNKQRSVGSGFSDSDAEVCFNAGDFWYSRNTIDYYWDSGEYRNWGSIFLRIGNSIGNLLPFGLGIHPLGRISFDR